VPDQQINEALDFVQKYHTALAKKSQYIYGWPIIRLNV
jgi:hypothetical protein